MIYGLYQGPRAASICHPYSPRRVVGVEAFRDEPSPEIHGRVGDQRDLLNIPMISTGVIASETLSA